MVNWFSEPQTWLHLLGMRDGNKQTELHYPLWIWRSKSSLVDKYSHKGKPIKGKGKLAIQFASTALQEGISERSFEISS